MSLLLAIGSFFLWSLIKLLTTLAFAIPAGIGLGTGFHLSKQFINWRYKRKLEQKYVGGEAAAEGAGA